MLQHADDLRAEIAREGGDTGLADAVLADWRSAGLEPVDAALCAYAEKLTREPAANDRGGPAAAARRRARRPRRYTSRSRSIAFFNYINRVADAVHVELEPEMPPYPDGSR